MISSTFMDLKEHRAEAIKAIEKLGFKAEVMEHSGASDTDVIAKSLQMVNDAAAYVGVISRRYGDPPVCPKRNPEQLSLTELEFDEAVRLGRPILLFTMGKNHPVTEGDVELDSVRRQKLDAFRERAKVIRPGEQLQRIYESFESKEQFVTAAAIAIGNLARLLPPFDAHNTVSSTKRDTHALPRPPELAALPPYLGSHDFVGRAAQLEVLDDWCVDADPNPVLLFEAIGGSGKSFLTWKWLIAHAPRARSDWAGRFWYSFYEKGAVMADFCRQALSYMTDRPLSDFSKFHTHSLGDLLLAELNARSWLVVLDGLERVLVAYHRADAAQMTDEEVEDATDQIAGRDPCASIRPEDDELLRRLVGVSRSKVLVTSRLTPWR